MKTKPGLLILGMGLMLTLSCSKYPPASDRLTEDLVVVTQTDTKADFNTYKHYSLGGSIIKITDKDTLPLTGATAEALLAAVDRNMQSRGFTKAAAGDTIDLGIEVLYYQNTTVYTYYYDYWGYYYPYYSYYPVYYASYTTGMLNIQMLDLKNADKNTHRASICWNAFIRGVLTGSHTTAEFTGRVDQAFIQSPDVKTNR